MKFSTPTSKLSAYFEIATESDLLRNNLSLPKGQPMVAGSINWARSLFHRIKKTIVRFNSLKEMLDTELGKTVTAKYMVVAKSLKEYEDTVIRCENHLKAHC